MENQNEETIDLLHLLKELYSNKLSIIIVTVVCAAAVYFYSSHFITPVYTATTSIYVMNTEGNGEGIDVSDITASQMLVKTYSIVLLSDVIMDEVSTRLIDKYDIVELNKYFNLRTSEDGEVYIPSKQIAALISINNMDETEMLYISATTPDPILSADICNYLMDIAPTAIADYVGSSFVNTVSRAKTPTAPSGPNSKKNGAVAGAAGFAFMCAVVILRELLNNTVKDSETLKNRFGIPVLGEIPKFNVDDGGKA